MKLKFTGADGKPMSMQGWSAGNNSSDCTAWAPLHMNGKVVALAVAKGDYDGLPEKVIDIGKQIETACNSHDALTKALKQFVKLTNNDTIMVKNEGRPKLIAALAAANAALAGTPDPAASTANT